MADKDLDLDVKGGNKLNTILLIVLIVLVLAVGGIAAWLFMQGSGEEKTAAAEGEKPAAAKPEPKPAHYLKLDPEFVINFADTSRARYLQLEVQLMARDSDILSKVEADMPLIRNELLILFSGQSFEVLSTREGKEQLRQEVQATINKALGIEPEATGIEAVYFTSLIMQ